MYNKRMFFAPDVQAQGDQKYAGKMRDQFLKMRHKMRAYLIQLLNKIFL